jgi:hypothetical protein
MSAKMKVIKKKRSQKKNWGVGLADGCVGMCADSHYYSTRFNYEREAREWCDKKNNPPRADSCRWLVRDLKREKMLFGE